MKPWQWVFWFGICILTLVWVTWIAFGPVGALVTEDASPTTNTLFALGFALTVAVCSLFVALLMVGVREEHKARAKRR